jgi:hypothetical protein
MDAFKTKLISGIKGKTTDLLPPGRVTTPVQTFGNRQIENWVNNPELNIFNPLPPIPISLKGTTTDDLINAPYSNLKNKFVAARRARLGG